MNYITIELQTNDQWQTANIVTVYDNLPQAQSKYFTILAAAALSNIHQHAAVILDETGMTMAQQCFTHEVQ